MTNLIYGTSKRLKKLAITSALTIRISRCISPTNRELLGEKIKDFQGAELFYHLICPFVGVLTFMCSAFCNHIGSYFLYFF